MSLSKRDFPRLKMKILGIDPERLESSIGESDLIEFLGAKVEKCPKVRVPHLLSFHCIC